MESPWPQINIQAGITHLVTASVVAFARKDIPEAPMFSPQIIPWHVDMRLYDFAREIHDGSASSSLQKSRRF